MGSLSPRVTPYHIVLGNAALCVTAKLDRQMQRWVIHVALVASVNRPHVRFASESNRLPAQQEMTLSADFVAKVFLRSRSKFLLAVQATSM